MTYEGLEGVPTGMQDVGQVRMADVALVLRDLNAGAYRVAGLYERYVDVARSQGHPIGLATSFGVMLTRLGAGPNKYQPSLDGDMGRWIDPGGMARRWPRLPWRD